MKQQMRSEQEIRRGINAVYELVKGRSGWHFNSAVPVISMLLGFSQRRVKEYLLSLIESGKVVLVKAMLYAEVAVPSDVEVCPLCHRAGKLYPNTVKRVRGKEYLYDRFVHYKGGKQIWHNITTFSGFRGRRTDDKTDSWAELTPDKVVRIGGAE